MEHSARPVAATVKDMGALISAFSGLAALACGCALPVQASAPGTGGGMATVPEQRGWVWGQPGAVALVGQRLFVAVDCAPGVACSRPGRVVELDASTGGLIKVLGGPRYLFHYPVALAVRGRDLFVDDGESGNLVTYGPDSVTEIDSSTGAVIRAIHGGAYRLDGPSDMAVHGRDLFVANFDGDSVTEIDASTGALVRVIDAPAYGFDGPDGITPSGNDLFVMNTWGSLTELDASSGALVRVMTNPPYDLSRPGPRATLERKVALREDWAGRALSLRPRHRVFSGHGAPGGRPASLGGRRSTRRAR